MPFFHFGPEETRTLIQLARGMIGKLNLMLMCEGDEDERDLNALTNKLGIPIPNGTGLTCCGGVDQLQELSRYVAALANVSRTLKGIVLIIDADTSNVAQRVQSLIQSLRSHNIQIENPELVSGSIYRATARSLVGSLNFLVKIAGEMSLPFTSHERDDYAVRLLILNGAITMNELAGFSKSSDFLDSRNEESNKIIQNSPEANVRDAYENIINLLQML
jgi:hypothetical protein